MSQRSYRPDIEGLRGVAVLLVVAFHATPRRIPGGFIGVDVFFVLSGYLITALLVREIEETGGLSLAGFYARRARRLLPASALVFLTTVLACMIFLPPMQQFHLGDSGSQTALYISNFWFLRRATDYFSAGIGDNPFLHTWSLAVEEQFYLAWPLIVLFGLRGRRPHRALLLVMTAIGFSSFALSVWLTRTLQPWAFFSPFSRAWEFAIGGLTLLLASRGDGSGESSRTLRALASWIGLGAIVASGALLQGEAGFPGWRALIPVVGTAAILHGPAPYVGASKILESPALQWLGRLSYSWYLWHWPVFVMARAVHPVLAPIEAYTEAAVCVVLSLGLAAATHVLLENPIRFSRYLAPRRVLSLSLAALVTLISCTVAIVWQRSVFRAARALERARLGDAAQAPVDAGEGGCVPVGFLGAEVVECATGDVASKMKLVLFGDSHASQWMPAFQAIAHDRGWYVILIRKPACPTARLTIFNPYLMRTYTECDAWREASLTRIIELRPAAVVIANRQVQNFSPGLNGAHATWRDGTRKTLEVLDTVGLRTILVRDTPSPAFNVPECLAGNLSWWDRKNAKAKNLDDPCTTNRRSALDDGIFRAEQEAAQGLSHVASLDLSDLFCDGAQCPPVKNGLLVYRDNSHITSEFARSLAPAFGDRLASLISHSDR